MSAFPAELVRGFGASRSTVATSDPVAPGAAAALKFIKRIMRKYGRAKSIVTDGLCSYSAAMSEIGNADRRRLGVDSTIARRIHISRFDEENGPCSGFEARRCCRSSAQFTPRSTTILIRNAISSPVKYTNRDARRHLSNGARSWPKPHTNSRSVAPH